MRRMTAKNYSVKAKGRTIDGGCYGRRRYYGDGGRLPGMGEVCTLGRVL